MNNFNESNKKTYRTRVEINRLLENPEQPPKLDTSNLPLFLQNYLAWIGPTTHCSSAALILSIIAVVGALLRKAFRIQGPADEHFPNLWMVITGRSGTAKSTGVSNATNPIVEVEQEFMQLYKNQAKAYELKLKNDPDLDEEPPKSNKLSLPVVSSLERLYEILATETEAGFIQTTEELGAWFKNLMKVDVLKEFITSLYSGKNVANFISYRNSKDYSLPQNAIISILGTSTPNWIFKNLAPEDFGSGFFQRFSFVYAESDKEMLALPQKADPKMREAIKQKFREIYSLSLGRVKKEPILIGLSEETKNHFVNETFPRYREDRTKHQDDDLRSCLDRYWNETLFKIALILHCLEKNPLEALELDLQTFKQAEHLTRYLAESIKYTIEQIHKDPMRLVMRKIVDLLRKQPGKSLKENLLVTGLHGYDRRREIIYVALEEMIEMELLDKAEIPNNSNNGSKSYIIKLLEK